MFETLIKAVSLGYLLGIFHLTLAVIMWRLIRGRITPGLRADTGFLVFLGASLMTLFGTIYIFYGVISLHIAMTTNYFHKLMHGGGSATITAMGIGVMILSLVMAAYSFSRARLKQDKNEVLEKVSGLNVKFTKQVSTACVVGVIHPQVWVNPDYWAGLDVEERALAFRHERQHIRRKDNFRKLLMQFIAALYSIFPWIRAWPESYELDSELAVDDYCRGTGAGEKYRRLIANATSFSLNLAVAAIASGLSHSDIKYRLGILNADRKSGSRTMTLFIAGLTCMFSTVPVLILLSYTNSRCMLACYLGY